MSQRLRVASFNIRSSRSPDRRDHWLLRRRACAEAIWRLGADVVGLQEVRPRQLAYLRRAFPGAALVGTGREANGGGEHATVLVNPPWEIESVTTRWLSATPQRPSRGWDASCPRVATAVTLRRGDARLGVVNTHFDHLGTLAREQSAALLVDWLAGWTDRHWVIIGDLNATPDSATLRTLLAAGYRDALAGERGGTEHAFTGSPDRKRIDYILVGPGVAVLAAEIRHDRPGGRLPSDHWPVVAELALPR